MNTNKTTKYGVGTPGPDLEQAQACSGVKPINEFNQNYHVTTTRNILFFYLYYMFYVLRPPSLLRGTRCPCSHYARQVSYMKQDVIAISKHVVSIMCSLFQGSHCQFFLVFFYLCLTYCLINVVLSIRCVIFSNYNWSFPHSYMTEATFKGFDYV